MAEWVCTNRDCKSFGKPHPHCLCAPPTEYAQGGCVGPHKEDCEHYLADGGQIAQNNQFIQNPTLAVAHAVAHHGLLHTLTKTGHSKSPDETMPHQDFLEHTRKGESKHQTHMNGVFGKSKPEPLETNIEGLKNHVDQMQANPGEMFNVGGNLGQHYPDHAAALAQKAAVAQNYLTSIKPKGFQPSPTSPVIPPSRMEDANYDRQLRIAENPLSILGRVRNGTVTPSEVNTLQTIYPEMHQAMISKAFEHLTESKDLSRKQKMGLSTLLGQPLDYIQTPAAAMAIMQSNSSPQPQPQEKKSGGKATNVELKQVNKVNEMSATPLQSLQIDKKA